MTQTIGKHTAESNNVVLPRERGVPGQPDHLLLLGFLPRFVFDYQPLLLWKIRIH
jgi:hypothetical protein